MTNQSELDKDVEEMVRRWFGEPVIVVEEELAAYITANYTPNSEVV